MSRVHELACLAGAVAVGAAYPARISAFALLFWESLRSSDADPSGLTAVPGRVYTFQVAVFRAVAPKLGATPAMSMHTEANSANRIARAVGLGLLLLVLPAVAQPGPILTPLPNNPSNGIESAPIAKDQNGNPIQQRVPTAAEREVENRENELRAEKQRAEDERNAAEARLAAEQKSNTELLAEEKESHNRIMTAIYVGLAIVAAGVGWRFLKRRSRFREDRDR